MTEKIKVLYCTAECSPFSKVGGVACVAGELPLELKNQGIDIEIITPHYGSIEQKHNLTKVERGNYEVEFNGKKEQVQLYRSGIMGVPVTFIANETYFGTKEIFIHSDIPFDTDAKRFSFLSQACIPIIEARNPNIVHVNDWQFGYLLGLMKIKGIKAKRVTTIHNLGYQGNQWTPRGKEISSLIRELTENPATSRLFQDPHSDWQSINPFRLALEMSDMVNTVSPNYAKEILLPEDQSRYFEGGKGLEGIARRLNEEGRLLGIINGYPYPEEPTEENFRTMIAKKQQAKEQMSFAFKNPKNPLFGFVGRAVDQKIRLLKEELNGKPVLEHLLEIPGINFMFLGTGEQEYEKFLREYHNGVNCSAIVAFDPKRADVINLGGDVSLMPSTYEPCGLNQYSSMARATPPLVRWTGGLVDTVLGYPSDLFDATGFGFEGNSREEVLRELIKSVVEVKKLYAFNPERFHKIQQNAFEARFTWEASTKRYIEEIYEPLLKSESHC